MALDAGIEPLNEYFFINVLEVSVVWLSLSLDFADCGLAS